jgi:hypothetical protein
VLRCRDLIARGKADGDFATRATAPVKKPATDDGTEGLSSWERRVAIEMLKKGRSVAAVAGRFGLKTLTLQRLKQRVAKLEEV